LSLLPWHFTGLQVAESTKAARLFTTRMSKELCTVHAKVPLPGTCGALGGNSLIQMSKEPHTAHAKMPLPGAALAKSTCGALGGSATIQKTAQQVIPKTDSKVGGQTAKAARGLRILSLDGGGVRGIIPCTILQHITEHKRAGGKPIHELFDLICGSSTGGIIAAGLTAGMTPSEIQNMYEQLAAMVFKKSISTWLFDKAKSIFSAPLYDAAVLEGHLRTTFGKLRMTELDKCRLFVVTRKQEASAASPIILCTYDYDTKLLYFDQDTPMKAYHAENSWSVVHALRATSAAPLYFPPLSYFGQNYIDGGVGCNNPAKVAVCEARRICRLERERFDRISCLVSIGTGVPPRSLSDNNTFSLTTVLRTLIEEGAGSRRVHEELAHSEHPFAYFRFDPQLTADIKLDDSDSNTLRSLSLRASSYIGGDDEQDKITEMFTALGL
jgi:uncharacterized metal-binding protein